MPAKDLYHDEVRQALEAEGWIITDDPLYFAFGEVDFYIDLGAEQLIAAEKGSEKIAIEIKGFSYASPVSAFHQIMGQYVNYRAALAEKDPERTLYLAIPKLAYDDFFQRPFVQKMIELEKLRLIIYDPNNQIILEWIH